MKFEKMIWLCWVLYLGVLLVITNSCSKDTDTLPVDYATISAGGYHALVFEPDGTVRGGSAVGFANKNEICFNPSYIPADLLIF